MFFINNILCKKQIEDAVCPSRCHEDKVKLLGDLSNRPDKGTVELQEGHKAPNGQTPYPIQGHKATGNGSQDEGDVTQVP